MGADRAGPHAQGGEEVTPKPLVAKVEAMRLALDADTLVIVCTRRGTVIEVDADVHDLPEGETVFSNMRPAS